MTTHRVHLFQEVTPATHGRKPHWHRLRPEHFEAVLCGAGTLVGSRLSSSAISTADKDPLTCA
jgi:hypothetical protein